MKILGIVALAMTVLSFLFWLVSWIISRLILPTAGYNSPVAYVSVTVSILSGLLEYVALVLISIGLILAARKTFNS